MAINTVYYRLLLIRLLLLPLLLLLQLLCDEKNTSTSKHTIKPPVASLNPMQVCVAKYTIYHALLYFIYDAEPY